MASLEEYYNKFNEEKRLNSRHGRIEFTITMKYLHEYLKEICKDRQKEDIKIIDIGAGTGRYSVPLSEEGYQVTAVELVKHNLGVLKAKKSKVLAYQGNALNLKKFQDNSFDVALLFGPMYHLKKYEERLKALEEAKRITKEGGLIFVAYVMNEYAFLTYGIKEGHVLENIREGRLDEAFHTVPLEDDLYAFMRTEDIKQLNQDAGLKRIKIISPDGPANHMRREVNALTEEEFEMFIKYQMSVCEREDLLGASAHTVDILIKE